MVDPGGGLVPWLTPYGNARALLAGTPTQKTLAALFVVTLLWCAIPTLMSMRRTTRRAPG